MSQEQREEELTLDKVSSGDRPSLYALGLAVSAALKSSKMAVVMVDVFGRVRLMPNESVAVQHVPRIEDEELHQYTEEAALEILVQQGDSEEQILEYIARRKAAES